MVYSFSKNGIMINKKFGNIELALLDQIPYLLHKGMYMKICKRINSIERATKNPNTRLLHHLYSLFTSDLGLLNQVISDISVLEYLIENVKHFSKQRFECEIEQMKSRLGNMTNLKYLKKQNVVIELLNELGKDTVDLSLIEKLKDVLFNILQSETLKKMKKYKLYPIPDDYLPHTRQIEGGKLKVNSIPIA